MDWTIEETQLSFYQRVGDYRGYMEKFGNTTQWRLDLRKRLFKERFGRSDLTQMPLIGGFDMHEGLYQRRWIPKAGWQELLFAGPNCFLLSDIEHRVNVPDRTICYWISVTRYGKRSVDDWIDSLPWKVLPDKPWRGTCGIDIIAEIPDKWRVATLWYEWFGQHKRILDTEA